MKYGTVLGNSGGHGAYEALSEHVGGNARPHQVSDCVLNLTLETLLLLLLLLLLLY